MHYRNQFTLCDVRPHSSGSDLLSCLNLMGSRQSYFVYNGMVAMCEYHMCAVLLDRADGSHSTVACSGSILRFGDDRYYFNPLTPFGVNFDNMLPLSRSSVDYFAKDVQYYFQNDVRSKFSSDITGINCTNSMRTCLRFEGGAELCFGNTELTPIIHSTSSLMLGILASFTVGVLSYLFLRNRISRSFPLTFALLFYIVPLVGIHLVFSGFFLSMSIPFLIGMMIVVFIFSVVYYPLRDMRKHTQEASRY